MGCEIIKNKKVKLEKGERTYLVVPSKRGGGSEVEVNGGGRCCTPLIDVKLQREKKSVIQC